MLMRTLRLVGLPVILALFLPTGFLFAAVPAAVGATSPSVNWADAEEATTMFNNVQKLARKVRNEGSPLETNGIWLGWRINAHRLNDIRSQVNEMSSDIGQLSKVRENLDPWQQRLLARITPDVQELVYQTRAAIHALNSRLQDPRMLAATNYPNDIFTLCHKSKQVVGSIGTFTQYNQTKQKLAALRKQVGTKTSS